MADVFISYSSKDRALAEALARDIQATGWSVWWDPEIRAGEDFTERILAELDSAKAVVVVWTKHSVKSDWVRSEARRAMRAPRDRYVAVRVDGLDDHDIPPPFDGRHAVNVSQRSSIVRSLQLLAAASAPSDAQCNLSEQDLCDRISYLYDLARMGEMAAWEECSGLAQLYLEHFPDGSQSEWLRKNMSLK